MEIVFIVELSIGFLFLPSFSVVPFALPQPSCLVFAIRKQSENQCCQVQMHLIFKVQLGFFALCDEFYTETDTWYLSKMANSAKSTKRSILARCYCCCHCEFHHCKTFWAKTAQFSAFINKGLTGIKEKPCICLGAQQKGAGARTTMQRLFRRGAGSLRFSILSKRPSKQSCKIAAN